MAKEYKLENYKIIDNGIWIGRNELERLYKAYNAYKSDLSSLRLGDLIYKIKSGK